MLNFDQLKKMVATQFISGTRLKQIDNFLFLPPILIKTKQ